jgi:hypothetical protein
MVQLVSGLVVCIRTALNFGLKSGNESACIQGLLCVSQIRFLGGILINC